MYHQAGLAAHAVSLFIVGIKRKKNTLIICKKAAWLVLITRYEKKRGQSTFAQKGKLENKPVLVTLLEWLLNVTHIFLLCRGLAVSSLQVNGACPGPS